MPFIKKTRKPDPDLIARPRELKDPRFNKDPRETQRRAAAKRDARLGLATPASRQASAPSLHGLAQASPTAHPRWANWSPSAIPTPALVTSPASSTRLSASSTRPDSYGQPITQANSTPKLSPAPATAASPSASMAIRDRALPVVKTAMDVAPAMHSSTTTIPAWAGPLEKLLAEGKANERSSTLPPHLRKSHNPSSDVKLPHPQPGADLDAHFRAASEASRRASDATSSTLSVVDSQKTGSLVLVQQSAQAQENAPPVETSSDAQAADYQRYLDVALIKFMEGELDLGSHGTKAQLLAMDSTIFAKYLEKMKVAHKQLWISKKESNVNSA